jgi:hypothetical protein
LLLLLLLCLVLGGDWTQDLAYARQMLYHLAVPQP